ncbi:HAMP domain-containing sensor histidine kinase [Brevibacillus centrosporus]|uniref:sensor histidine kinase n=1 Tax=Brevibacillus centrosporus TaxID=54910 RepID=UPI0014776289|nr:HAMP domain-containing sensor histidine kinase [Brevibacillus centrosporus]MEC2133348.1 HAMP domain-containing sensor histidine kinase [Brevibacillus centrosporus]
MFLIVLLPVGFVIERIFSGFYLNEVRNQIEQTSSHYAQMLSNMTTPDVLPMIEMMAGITKYKLYIVDDHGVIIVNTGITNVIKGKTVPTKEISALTQGETIEKVSLDSNTGERYLVYGTPILNRQSFYGGVYVIASLEGIDQSLQKVRTMLLLAGFGTFFLALGFTYVISKKLSDPLIQMERAARRIAKGDLGTRVLLTTKDEIGSLANAINDLACDLKRYRDMQREFFVNISHELRTPITYLEGYSKVLKEKLYQSPDEEEKYLDIIREEAGRLSRMIGELFDLSKMDEGKISLIQEWIDMTEVLEGAIETTSIQAKEKGLNVHLQVFGEAVLAYCDGNRLTQVFINLLDNAIRYTETGTVTVDLWYEKEEIKITIKDTGIGIPTAELPYIFDRFYRVEKSRSRQYGGTGLGLSIVKNLVELQGGKIGVTSIVGKGTCFEITFPRTAVENTEEENE